MPATFETKEELDDDLTQEEIDELIDLRIKAGAIRCYIKKIKGKRYLITEWNVIGEND